MEMDAKTLEQLRLLGPREAYETVRRAVLQSHWGASSDDLLRALEQAVEAGILTWDDVESFESQPLEGCRAED
jgi:hypothetical protein